MDLWTPAKICEIWTLQGCGAPWHKIAPNRISKWVWLRSKNHNRCLTFVASAFSWQPGGHEEARQRARHCCGSVINSVHLHLVHYAWSTGTDQLNTTLAIEHKTHPVRQRRLFTGGLAMKISQEGFLRMFSGRPGAVLSVPLDRVITRTVHSQNWRLRGPRSVFLDCAITRSSHSQNWVLRGLML